MNEAKILRAKMEAIADVHERIAESCHPHDPRAASDHGHAAQWIREALSDTDRVMVIRRSMGLES